MKRSIVLFLLAAVMTLSACGNTTGTGPRIADIGFDGARVVSINGHSNVCGWTNACTGLGAQWSSSEPNHAILMVYLFHDIKGILGARLNIDGQVYNLEPLRLPTGFNELGAATQESRKPFAVSLDIIRQITNSKRTWIRVNTTAGSVENAVIDGTTDSKAYYALKRFLAEVDQAKRQ